MILPMQVLDSLSESNPMLPRSDEKLMDRANSLMQVEQEGGREEGGRKGKKAASFSGRVSGDIGSGGD